MQIFAPKWCCKKTPFFADFPGKNAKKARFLQISEKSAKFLRKSAKLGESCRFSFFALQESAKKANILQKTEKQ